MQSTVEQTRRINTKRCAIISVVAVGEPVYSAAHALLSIEVPLLRSAYDRRKDSLAKTDLKGIYSSRLACITMYVHGLQLLCQQILPDKQREGGGFAASPSWLQQYIHWVEYICSPSTVLFIFLAREKLTPRPEAARCQLLQQSFVH